MEKPAAKRVLVVDDDPVIGKSFDRVLTGKGYAVIRAASGEEALKKLNEGDYDAVFTDVRMPGMSGIDLAKSVRKTRPWLPVLIVTAYGSTEVEKQAGEAGVSDFLRKPLTPEMIEDAAKRATAPHAEVVAESPAETAVPAVETAAKPSVESVRKEEKVEHKAKDVALFFAAPFVGLMYFLALPFAGLGLAAWYSGEALEKKWELTASAEMLVLRNIFFYTAAPLIGLVYIIVLPITGSIFLIWYAWKKLSSLF